jgi:serpin B
MAHLISVLCLVAPLTVSGPPDVAAIVAANNRLAIDLYHQLARGEGNRLLSPYSITKALAMTYAGARGDTAREMAATLHLTLDQKQLHPAFRDTRKLLIGHIAGQRGVQQYLSANLWGQRGYRFDRPFLDVLSRYYEAGLQQVDFNDAGRARNTINAWVKTQTRGRIVDLFGPDSIDAGTRLVLVTAIYFKADWLHPFPKGQTHDAMFHGTSGPDVKVRMMSQTEKLDYVEDSQVQVLRMPYAGNALAMVALLPKDRDGLADLERALTADRLAGWLGRMRNQSVEVSLPRFKETSRFSLKQTLKALGMKKAFSPDADFSGMSAQGGLFIGDVAHQAFAEVNEEGTEAAAATGVNMEALSARPLPPRPPVVFRADHPFLFAICDTQTGMLMFLGRVTRP